MGAETNQATRRNFPRERESSLWRFRPGRFLILMKAIRSIESTEKRATPAIRLPTRTSPLATGVAFPLVRKLLALNAASATPSVEVISLSRNSADTGLRVFNSIRHHGLDITRAAFTRGESPYRYIEAFGAHLFLSVDPDDVRGAMAANVAAATILPSAVGANDNAQLRIAFDGDAVLFSDESERIYAENGLEAFNQSEMTSKDQPLTVAPFKPFAALHEIQSEFPAADSPIRTALITARGAPAHERVIRTLRSWGIRIDEALFLGGKDKGASEELRCGHLL